ncbi:hypothetical protein D9757_009887 [Collybiopsis confluens]|uniref:Uncharacterized protein n=1 Tax=Collybiopsis confluens TaxID=2823264 RepID=A0A8H5GTK8_9AGAR|nr:hypothetical protein D9757_009887 [Collybiopsis confluens]
MNLIFLTLLAGLSFVNALPQPQAASVTIFQFESTSSGINPTSISGTEWADPIGTASGGSNTTFLIENVFTATGLVLNGGSTQISTATSTDFITLVVSASGWIQSNFPTTTSAGSTQLGGGTDCHFTSSTSGECVQEEVIDDGSTSTRTVTGNAITLVLPISTGALPGSPNSQSTQQITVTTLPLSPSNIGSTSATSASVSATSNAAWSMRASAGNMGSLGSFVLPGILLGAATVLA